MAPTDTIKQTEKVLEMASVLDKELQETKNADSGRNSLPLEEHMGWLSNTKW